MMNKGTSYNRLDGTISGYYAYLVRPEAPIQRDDSSYRRGAGYSSFYGLPMSNGLVVSGSAMAVNTMQSVGFSDSRFHQFAIFTFFEKSHSIISISDNFIISNADDMCWLYKRSSITEYEQVCRIGRHTYHCDHTLSEVAVCYDSPFIFDIRKQSLKSIYNNEGAAESIQGMFFIYGELYIIRETAIYKYVPQS